MNTYQLTREGYVIRDGDTKVPTVDTPEWPNTNPDYLAYLAWLADGGVPLPPDPPVPVVPESITRAQGKAALIQAGLWASVVAYVDAIPDPTDKALAGVALNDTLEWRRSSPFLNTAVTALDLTEGQLDALFITAAQIEL